jgi:hypothetical protein
MHAEENCKLRSFIIHIIRFAQIREGEICRSCRINKRDEY